MSLAHQNLSPLYYPAQLEAATQVARKTNPATLYRLIETLNRISPYGRHTLNVRMQVEYLLTEYLGFWQNKENTG